MLFLVIIFTVVFCAVDAVVLIDDDGSMPTTDLFQSITLLVSYFRVNKQARTPDAMLGVRFASGECSVE